MVNRAIDIPASIYLFNIHNRSTTKTVKYVQSQQQKYQNHIIEVALVFYC